MRFGGNCGMCVADKHARDRTSDGICHMGRPQLLDNQIVNYLRPTSIINKRRVKHLSSYTDSRWHQIDGHHVDWLDLVAVVVGAPVDSIYIGTVRP